MKNPIYPTPIANRPTTLQFIAALRICLIGLLLIVSHFCFSQSKYIKKYKPLADSLSSVYGVPTSIILGIAVMESGSCSSRNCKMLNNHFGIVGKNNLLKTDSIRSRYKQYPNGKASYVDFCKLMTKKKFYKTLKNNKDYTLWADAISKAGYSEIPEIWKERVISTIRKNKLAPKVD